LKQNKTTFRACLAIAFAIFVISPIDDVIIAALFGTALFGFGSISFYILLLASSTVSIIFWKRRKRRKEPDSSYALSSFNQ
jgi:hypothetical protein